MSGKSAEDYAKDYTDPELRARLKEEIKAGDRGGRPGQWSARKSQLLASEYEKAGGGYVHEGERTASQEHLQEWTRQDWHTADGDDRARGSDGTKRYLPDAAWELLSEEEKRATDTRKRGSDEQHVANTDAAKEARKAAELVDVTAPEARERVAKMHGDSQLDRAEQAEKELGKGRTTVLRAIEEQRDRG
jgi:DNA-binding TFAR19-related protein (PDSD5 family)